MVKCPECGSEEYGWGKDGDPCPECGYEDDY